MAEVIRTFKYSKTAGRGRGILGLTSYEPCRKPGERQADSSQTVSGRSGADQRPAPGEKNLRDGGAVKEPMRNVATIEDRQSGQSKDEQSGPSYLLIASHQYKANPNKPGGFTELSLEKGQLVEFIKEHPEHEEDWWEAKNENGEIGYIPSAYVIVKKDHALPWLQWTALQSEEEERKKRAQRMAMKKAAAEGKGPLPPPLSSSSEPKPFKPYVSAYGRDPAGGGGGGGSGGGQAQDYYCEVCAKKLNGPVPYQAHLKSKAHKEEVALLNES